MFIHEAVRKAIQTGGVIYRESVRRPESDFYALIKPTNSYETCQIIICKYGKKERSARTWSPTADDLAADDWSCAREGLTEKVCKPEKNLDSNNQNSYIEKEIRYQTALLQRLKHEVYDLRSIIEQKNEEQCSPLRKKFFIFKCKR